MMEFIFSKKGGLTKMQLNKKISRVVPRKILQAFGYAANEKVI